MRIGFREMNRVHMDEKSFRFIDLQSSAAVGGEERLSLSANIDIFGSYYGIVLTDLFPGYIGIRRGTAFPLIPITFTQVILNFGTSTTVPGSGELGRTSNFVINIQMGTPINNLDYRVSRPFTISLVGYYQPLYAAGDILNIQVTIAYRTILRKQFPN